jgi:uncharacterized protein (TIGR02996 family)
MKKKCFVIMPYGGDDPARKKHFDGVYQSIIVPGAVRAGYEVKRSDISGEPGNITHDIIRDLAESDIVIADLTMGNANVFFELGIRHAFRKSGTVHIIDAQHKLPFDVHHYRVIEYSTDLADIPEVIQAIATAIEKRTKTPNRPDNPVHDALPDLPIDFRSTGDEEIKKQLESIEVELQETRSENEKMAKKLSVLDPAGGMTRSDTSLDVSALLDQADSIMEFTGEHAILRLRQALDEKGAKEFAKELRAILESPYLDQNDFAEINVLCKKAGLAGHRRATLEVARSRYPNSDDLLFLLVDALDDSPNRDDQDRGRLIIEQALGIVHKDGHPQLSGRRPTLPLRKALSLLFNFYMRAGKWDWVLSVAEAVPESLRNDVLVLRNKAAALAHLGRDDEAERAYRKALETDPSDDTTLLWYANFLDEQGKTAEAYEQSENALLADPEQPRLWIHMAIQIMNRGFVRRGAEISGPISRKERTAAAVPFLLKASEYGSSADLMQEIVRILVRADAVEVAQAIASGQIPSGEFDTSPLDFVVGKLREKANARQRDQSTDK